MASRFTGSLRPADAATAADVKALVQQLGAADAARALGMRRETILALASDVRCTPGSYALARERLASVARQTA